MHLFDVLADFLGAMPEFRHGAIELRPYIIDPLKQRFTFEILRGMSDLLYKMRAGLPRRGLDARYYLRRQIGIAHSAIIEVIEISDQIENRSAGQIDSGHHRPPAVGIQNQFV